MASIFDFDTISSDITKNLNKPSITLKHFSTPPEPEKPKKRSLFSVEIEKIFKREGGYVNDPDDSGGETIYGISRRNNPEAWTNGPPSRQHAEQIYRYKYWDSIKGDYLPPKIASVLFDHAVLSGPGAAAEDLNKVLGTGSTNIDSHVVEAAWSKDENKVAEQLTARRLARFDKIVAKHPEKLKFYRAWTSRAVSAFHESDIDPDILGEQKLITPSEKSLRSYKPYATITSRDKIRKISDLNYAIKKSVLFKGTSIMEERQQADEINKYRDDRNADKGRVS